ncbi:MAG: hypothetical protein LQ337_005748 [Flavoplaca oasis]|nr:MAG: hypothetical protein LQ337_005748 [Flavoplaca oasis]
MPTPRLIIHGGAGAITPTNLPYNTYLLYSASLLEVNRSTSSRLAAGASALEAATEAVRMMEDNPLFNCGKGAVFTRDGRVELEASVMTTNSYHKRACAAVLLSHTKNPILLAKQMLIRGQTDGSGSSNGGGGDPSGGAGGAQGHCVLGGPTVEKLAEEWGLEMVEEKYFWTRKRWEQHKRGLGMGVKGMEENEKMAEAEAEDERDEKGYWWNEEGWDGKEYLPQGTVGCVVLDREGMMCVATSTGGLTNKLSGRIGDTPSIGAGFWAEEWLEGRHKQLDVQAPLVSLVPDGLNDILAGCLPGLRGYNLLAEDESHDGKRISNHVRAVAMSGTGNGDSFLRTAATRTAAAMARFQPGRSLASAVQQIAGSGGELQRSAGDRWGKTGEGEGGIIGIELINGRGKIVADFNCGGMFRCWIDGEGNERVKVFKEEYPSKTL